VQATFGEREASADAADGRHGQEDGARQDGGGGAKRSSSRRSQAVLLSMREGWRAYGFEEVEFRQLREVGDAPAWSLNDAMRARLSLRAGVFEEPPRVAADHAAEEPAPGIGPEPISMPEGLEEVLEAGADLSDELEEVMREQRNSTVLRRLLEDLERDTLRSMRASPHVPTDAAMLSGLPRSAINADLVRLLASLLAAAEGGTANIVSAPDAAAVFDGTWRQLGLDMLDAVFLRWRASQVWPQEPDSGRTSTEQFTPPPGFDVTKTLASAIASADEAIALRIRAKNEKLRDLTLQASSLATGGRAPRTRIELQGDSSQVMVVMETPSGTEIASVLQMDSAEVASLVESLNPSSSGGSTTGGESEDDRGSGESP